MVTKTLPLSIVFLMFIIGMYIVKELYHFSMNVFKESEAIDELTVKTGDENIGSFNYHKRKFKEFGLKGFLYFTLALALSLILLFINEHA